jgi:hypothetical protein
MSGNRDVLCYGNMEPDGDNTERLVHFSAVLNLQTY